MAFLIALLAACSEPPPDPVEPVLNVEPLALEEVEASLFLVGDAGSLSSPTVEGVLADLRSQVTSYGEAVGGDRVIVVFLGDNVYPDGMRRRSGEWDADAARALEQQIEVLAGTGARGIFLSGNHDWGGLREEHGRVCRQAEFLDGVEDIRVELLPENGCPGPQRVDLGDALALILLDTEWLRQNAEDPEEDEAESCSELMDCSLATAGQVLAELGAMVSSAAQDGRSALVLGHHPLVTGGEHRSGWGKQDITAEDYADMAHRVTEVLAGAETPPLLYAGGHDHNLQVMEGPGFPFHAVSGSGSKLASVGSIGEASLYYARAPGFLRLDHARDGRIQLTVWRSDQGQAGARFLLAEKVEESFGDSRAEAKP
ncbi:MAG: hypothetical protein SX243_16685 [Acidobacteriota bacterium]|nr:hypothetical protein [Acidobacteriota bacterium]